MRRIYLDHNATTPIAKDVVNQMTAELARFHANPASQHESGQNARRAIERYREQIAEQLGLRLSPPADEDRMLFTSGGTESNNLVLHSASLQKNCRVVFSAIEHPSIARAAESLAASGTVVQSCRVLANGQLDLDHLEQLLSPSDDQPSPASLLTVMLANHETGVIQPIESIIELAHRFSVPVHSDGSQAIGKLPFSFRDSGLDSLTFSAHKFHGPVGIGGLVTRRSFSITPSSFGGFQQQGLRPGTESVFLASGIAAALELQLQARESFVDRTRQARDTFEAQLQSELSEIVIHGADSPRLAHVSNIGFPQIDGQSFFVALDMAGIDCSTGSACASGSSELSPVLLAMGVESSLVAASFRFSFGQLNDAGDATEAASRIIKCYKHLRQRN